MPEIDLAAKIPPEAKWIKLHYEMKPLKPDAELIARVWSGSLEDAYVIKGASGDVFVELGTPQKVSYQRPVNIELKLRLVAYKTAEA